VPKTICLTESAEFEALAVELALALGLAVPELEQELELASEHPAVASGPVATTATPSRGVIRMLKCS
jgi:Mg/Co/Ni transporter MgtE